MVFLAEGFDGFDRCGETQSVLDEDGFGLGGFFVGSDEGGDREV